MEGNNNQNEDKHLKVKTALKVVGFLLLIVGAVFAIVGFVDFFSSMNDFGKTPTLFWMLFIGLPCLGIGGSCLTMGYRREIGTYVANESAPVVNHMAKEIKPAIKHTASAIKEGLTGIDNHVICTCGTTNEMDAKFCNSCGKALKNICQHCHVVNNGQSKFCKECGKEIRK